MDAQKLLTLTNELLGVDFYTGVPDSQLRGLCDTLCRLHGTRPPHVVAANEGAAAALAAGPYLATGRPALVYLQNSGLGNAVNPVASLLSPEVYGIPALFIVGWRGEPGTPDEPQHRFQGAVTLGLTELLRLHALILSRETDEKEVRDFLARCAEWFRQGESAAIVVKKGALTAGGNYRYEGRGGMTRERALEILMRQSAPGDLFVATTGKLSREWYELREKHGMPHARDFLTVGSMGHASMIAAGIALARPDRRIWCLDGDGAALMHMGSLYVAAQAAPPCFLHVIFNNAAHESVGGMPVLRGEGRFAPVARACGYRAVLQAATEEELEAAAASLQAEDGPALLEVLVDLRSRPDLGRPGLTPRQSKEMFMDSLREGGEGKPSGEEGARCRPCC